MTYPQGPQQPQGGYPQQQSGYPQQQPGYPQQQGYPPQPGGYPGYPPPPRKKNTGLIVALSALGAAAVIAVVLVIVLSGKDDSSPTADGVGTSGKPDVSLPGPNGGGKTSGGSKPSGGSSGGSTGARELAEQAVDIINSHDASAMAGLTCDSNATKELTQALGTLPASATATLGDVKEQGTYGQAIIKITMSGKSQTVSLEMSKHGSKWCAAGL
jgi:hypothetical protein